MRSAREILADAVNADGLDLTAGAIRSEIDVTLWASTAIRVIEQAQREAYEAGIFAAADRARELSDCSGHFIAEEITALPLLPGD